MTQRKKNVLDYFLLATSFFSLFLASLLPVRASSGFAPPDSPETFFEAPGSQAWVFADDTTTLPRKESRGLFVKNYTMGRPVPVLRMYEQRTSRGGVNILRSAFRFLGVPYVWAGTSGSGFDCSGFVWRIFRINGIFLPRMADSQFLRGKTVRRENLRAGDLVFFSTYLPGPSHVGIYLGAGRFIHASSGRGVVVSSLGERYYNSRYIGGRRLIDK